VDSSPVVVDGKVLVGSEDGRLYMLGLADGKELWNYELGSPVMSSPAVTDGMVIVGANDGTVYAFRG
jgi:outer membrane protein assembly factor BamB